MEDEYGFKGVWIPKEIWLDMRLSAVDKVIFAIIDGLDKNGQGCFASNQYIADFCQCSERKVTDSISKLTKFGLVEVAKFDGRSRILKSRLAYSARETSKNCEADTQNLPPYKKDNNIDEQKDYKRENLKRSSDTQLTQDFEAIWDAYPNKKGKTNALRDYIKARRKGVTDAEILMGIDRYKMWIKANHKEQYIKNGSTWFHQECWNDDYTIHYTDIRDVPIDMSETLEAWARGL